MSHSDANERECYICKCVESDSDEEKLIQQKCACSPYVHSQCLREFCMGYWHKTTCSTCKEVIRNVSIQPPPFYLAFGYFLKDICTCIRLEDFVSAFRGIMTKLARDPSTLVLGIRELLIWAGIYVSICLLGKYFSVVNASSIPFMTGWELVLVIGYSLWRRAKSYVWILMILMSVIRFFAVMCLTDQTVHTLRGIFTGQSLLVIWERQHRGGNSEEENTERNVYIEERPLHLYNIDEEYVLVRLHFSSYIRPLLVSMGLPICFIESGIGTIIRLLRIVMSDTPYSTLIHYWTQAYRRYQGGRDDQHISLHQLEEDVHGVWKEYTHMTYPLCVYYDLHSGWKFISELPERRHVEEPLEEYCVDENDEDYQQQQQQEEQASSVLGRPAWWWAYFERFLFYDWYRQWKQEINSHGNEGDTETREACFHRSEKELITISINILLTMVRYTFWKFFAASFLSLLSVGGRTVTDIPPDTTIAAFIASFFSVYMTVDVNALSNDTAYRQLCGELLMFPYVLCGDLCGYFLPTLTTILFVHQYWSLVYDDVQPLESPQGVLYGYKEQDAALVKTTSQTEPNKKKKQMSSDSKTLSDSAGNRFWPPVSLSWDTLLDYLNFSDSSLVLVYYNTYISRRVADIAWPATVLCMLGVVGDVSVESMRRSWASVSGFGSIYLLMTIILASCGFQSSQRRHMVRVAIYMSQMLCLYGLGCATVVSSLMKSPPTNTGGILSSAFYRVVCPWLCKCGVDVFESIHRAYSRVKNGNHILPTFRFPRFTRKPQVCSLTFKTCPWTNHPTFITVEQGMSHKYKGTRFICRRPVKRWGNIYALWGYTACIALLYVNLGICCAIAILPFVSHWPLLGWKILAVILPFLCVYIVPFLTRGIIQKISWYMYQAEFKTTQLVSFPSRVMDDDDDGPRLWSLLEGYFNDATLPLSDSISGTLLCQTLAIGWVSLPTDYCDACTWREVSSSLPLLLEMVCWRTCILTLWYLVSYLARWCFQWSVYIYRLDEVARKRHWVITTDNVDKTQDRMCWVLWFCIHNVYIFALQSLPAWRSPEEQRSFIQFYVCMAFFCENLLPYAISYVRQKAQEFTNYLQHTYMELGWRMSTEEVNDCGAHK